MKTVREILALSLQYISSKNPEIERHELEIAVAHTLGLKRLDLYLNLNRPLEEKEVDRIRDIVKRLSEGEPIQYIEGVVSFIDCEIEVNSSVLIPRPETEQLVEHVLGCLKGKDLRGKTLWDICTGSGCIGIALKKHFPEIDVVLSDISPAALEVASRNAFRNNVSITLQQGDLFSPFVQEKANYIISNPPYISASEFPSLSKSVRNFEPKLALVAEDNGFRCYTELSEGLNKYLLPEGEAWFECGYTQGDAIKKIFEKKGYVTQLFYDYAKIARGVHIIR